jgi:hypothetical protein
MQPSDLRNYTKTGLFAVGQGKARLSAPPLEAPNAIKETTDFGIKMASSPMAASHRSCKKRSENSFKSSPLGCAFYSC